MNVPGILDGAWLAASHGSTLEDVVTSVVIIIVLLSQILESL